VVFYGWFRGILDANAVVLHRLIMSDEAHFHFSGYINKQIANIGAISYHTVCLKASTQFKNHNLVNSLFLKLLGLISMKQAPVQSP